MNDLPAPGPTFAGPLFISVTNGDAAGLFAGARTTSTDFKFGLFYLAVSDGQVAETEAWIYGLEQTATDRTNLALVNVGGLDAGSDAFRIEIFDGSTGTKVKTVDGVVLPAKGWTQIGSILAANAPGVANAYARITRGEGFDLIFCDVMMPDMGGAYLYSALNTAHPGLAKRIVFMSGGTFSPGAEQFLESVANQLISKPFTVEGVKAIVADYVR